MARLASESAWLRKQVKKAQNKAKFVGIFYLFASILLLGVTAIIPLMQGGETVLVVKAFYLPIKAIFDGGAEGIKQTTFEEAKNALCAILYALMILGMAINVLRGFAKLGWLFKVRASRINGVNRNMYAMDDLAKRFSGSFALIVIFNLLIYLVMGVGVYQITKFGFLVLGACVLFHILFGVIGGGVAVFTVGEKTESIRRDGGLAIFCIRNLCQFVAIGIILYFLIPNSVIMPSLKEIFKTLIIEKAGFSAINYSAFAVMCVEGILWLFMFVLIKHATADTEFNREGMFGSGILNFRIFSFLVFLASGALVAFSYLGFGMTAGINTAYVIVAGVALVAFLLDCILRPRGNRTPDAVEEYFSSDNYNWYNNTII